MNLKVALLNVLAACGSYSLPAPLLKTQAHSQLGGPIGDSEFADALAQLKNKGLINSRTDDLTGDARWFITEAGKTRAAQ